MTDIIVNHEAFQRKVKRLQQDGVASLHVIADFDKTITKAFVNGTQVRSSFALIREGKYLGEGYTQQSFALYDKYHPFEVDPTIRVELRDTKMREWWESHWTLMVASGMNKGVIRDIIRKQSLELRDGTQEFFAFLADNKVPLLILSSGLGDLIKEFLEEKGLLTENVHVVANFFEWDANERAIGFKKPLIHVFNKNEAQVAQGPYGIEMKERKNLLLLGDSLGDLHMSEGIAHDTLIRIGFLNEKEGELKESFRENFDVSILHDGSFQRVNELLKKI